MRTRALACTLPLGMVSIGNWLRRQGTQGRRHLVLSVALGETAGILLVLQTALLVAVGEGLIFRHAAVAALVPLFLAALAVIGLRAAAIWWTRHSAAAYSAVAKQTLRGACMTHLSRIGPVALAGMHAGEIAHTTVDAVEALDAYFSRYLPQRAIATLLPFTILAAVFPLDWISGLVLVLTAVFLPLSMILIGEESHQRNQRLWGSLARMSGRFLDILQGLATVRMFGAARREAREIERAAQEYRVLTMSVLRVAFLSSFMLELISAVSIAIVAVISGLRLLAGSMSFRPGYFILLIAPEYFLTLRSLGTFYHARMEAASAAEQIRALLDAPAVAEQPLVRAAAGHGAAQRQPSGVPSISFNAVTFAYAERQVLRAATFQLKAGERVAVMGESGAGKSTILTLLLRFAAAQEGRIEVDEVPLDSLDVHGWRVKLAWLPQRPTLFRGTIEENIKLGRGEASVAEVLEAARQAYVCEFLPRMTAGLQTKIGEGGLGLSVGQAQRVTLARLFLRKPSVVLLDEPTAHLDEESAHLVGEGIRSLSAGRTTILVTHKPLTAGTMDRILLLRDGKIEELS
jgi:ATP-binding cassette, subfamily C, bacterial CydD